MKYKVYDLTSVERENMVSQLWETGKYKSQAELARKLGIAEQFISRLLKGRELRLHVMETTVDSDTIEKTASLPDEERKEIIEAVEKGELALIENWQRVHNLNVHCNRILHD